MVQLMAANSQWNARPDDQRFETIADLVKATTTFKAKSVSSPVDLAALLTVADGKELRIHDRDSGGAATMTDWAFKQVCRYAGAPAGFLAELPAELASRCLNHGLAQTAAAGGRVVTSDAANLGEVVGKQAKLLFTQEKDDGPLHMRSMTGVGYTRIWNSEIASRLLELSVAHGWRVPPARPARNGDSRARKATKADVLDHKMDGLGIKEGDMIAPAGLYASDHDMFAFMVNENNRLKDGTDGGLGRGMFVYNSEVGAGSLRFVKFLYRNVCGNHIVWDASGVNEIAIRHVGLADEKGFREMAVTLKQYAEGAATQDEMRIKSVQTARLGADRDAVIRAVMGLRIPALSATTVGNAFDTTEKLAGVDGDPKTPWGIANGLTRLSQAEAFADARTVLDRAAGMILAKSAV